MTKVLLSIALLFTVLVPAAWAQDRGKDVESFLKQAIPSALNHDIWANAKVTRPILDNVVDRRMPVATFTKTGFTYSKDLGVAHFRLKDQRGHEYRMCVYFSIVPAPRRIGDPDEYRRSLVFDKQTASYTHSDK